MSVDVLAAPEGAAPLSSEARTVPPPRGDRRPSFRARLMMIVALNSLLWGVILWLLAGCAAPSAGPATMKAGGITMPPAGWIDYCGRHESDPGCTPVALDDAHLQALNGALASVAHVARRADRQEHWEVAVKSGDCEDIALAMRANLLGKGWPVEAVRLATAWTERGDYHVVLTIDGARRGHQPSTFILDSRFGRIMTYRELIAIGYRFHTRQAGRGPHWLTAA